MDDFKLSATLVGHEDDVSSAWSVPDKTAREFHPSCYEFMVYRMSLVDEDSLTPRLGPWRYLSIPKHRRFGIQRRHCQSVGVYH